MFYYINLLVQSSFLSYVAHQILFLFLNIDIISLIPNLRPNDKKTCETTNEKNKRVTENLNKFIIQVASTQVIEHFYFEMANSIFFL